MPIPATIPITSDMMFGIKISYGVKVIAVQNKRTQRGDGNDPLSATTTKGGKLNFLHPRLPTELGWIISFALLLRHLQLVDH